MQKAQAGFPRNLLEEGKQSEFYKVIRVDARRSQSRGHSETSTRTASELHSGASFPGRAGTTADMTAPCGQCYRPAPHFLFQISTRGTDAIRLCGQHSSPLENPSAHREFVSSGRSLRLTFRAHSSPQNKIAHLHKGFLALYQAVGEGPFWSVGRET